MDELNKLSLDPTEYSSIISLSGVIEKKMSDSDYIIRTDEDVSLPIRLHPKVVNAYDSKDFVVDETDEVDVLGCYVNVEKKPTILILRCVVYEKSPTLVS